MSSRKLLYGVGINDADYLVHPRVNGNSQMCPFYSRWSDMIKRGYSDRYHDRRPTYIGCTVCDEWLTFSAFKAWMEKQAWEDRQLDKDLINPTNKVYSPDTCMFVPVAINTLMIDCGAARGEYPIGVCFNKRDGKFQADIKIHGKSKYLGLFTTPEEAHMTYLRAKSDYILSILPTLTDEDARLVPALRRIAQSMTQAPKPQLLLF